ncbi:MAG: flagellar hook-basal body complex protein [Schwartzia sp.]|nr:flagellar hook-basal body complex protein [Schwartzia sp. (in: firmicutes)]
MMRSLFSGVSGLKNHQTRMDVIGNNISNVNTTGYKSSRATFTDMLSQTLTGPSSPSDNVGGTNPKQIGLGSSVSSIDLIFTNGSVQSTGKNTDLCISGNGLFVVKNNSGTYYTRDGAFEFDADGNYVLPGNGLFVQGWMANNGELTTTGETTNIVIPSGKSMASEATKTATYSNNLNGNPDSYTISNITINYADGTSGTATSYSPADIGTIALTFSSGETVTLDNTATYNFSTANTSAQLLGKTLYTSKIKSVTAATDGTVTLTTAVGDSVNSINGSTNYTVPGLTSGTYSIGDDQYTLSGTITTVEAKGTDSVDITLEDGTVVNVPKPTDFSYAAGDIFTAKLDITKIEANANAKVTTENGSTATLSAALTVNSTDDTYARKVVASDGTVKTVARTSTPTYGGKEVSSISINTKEGTILNGLLGQSYTAGGLFYPSVVTTVTTYDSLGGSHDIPVLFTKTGENTFSVTLSGGVKSYSYTESDGSTTSVSIASKDLKFTSSGAYSDGEGTLSFIYGNGAAEQSVYLNLSGLTQYIGSSTINANSDGHAAGTLSSVSIDTSGIITGTYTNGVKQAEAQVAVAQFNNASGLTKAGDSLYQESNNSGTANVKTASDLGVTLTPSALEMSNVDIANEFTDMIITQRGFQGNSKVVTVSDEMLETLINLKR